MSFVPKYTITDQLMQNIKRIYWLVQELNGAKFDEIVKAELQVVARELSAHASTSIEGNPLPLTEVKRVLKNRPEQVRDSEREVLNYNDTLLWLDGQLQDRELPLDKRLILEIQKRVTSQLLPKGDSGRLRKRAVVVNDPRLRKIVYLPPDYDVVPSLVDDLVGFVMSNADKIDPVLLAGIVHKQLVIIHPFMDGNGRTTRLVTKLLLARMGLNTFNLFSFENYYNQNVTKYFRCVGEYGDYNELKDVIDFTPWLTYFTEGMIDELLRVQQILGVKRAGRFKLAVYHQIILDYIREHGSMTDREYSQLTERAKATRVIDFNQLIKMDLIERKGQGRTTYYELKEQA